jgi:hypothetical protein
MAGLATGTALIPVGPDGDASVTGHFKGRGLPGRAGGGVGSHSWCPRGSL